MRLRVRLIHCIPVRVAMSRIRSGERCLEAYDTPSPNTSLPSASVLLISTWSPEYMSRISSFLNESGPTAFYARHKRAWMVC